MLQPRRARHGVDELARNQSDDPDPLDSAAPPVIVTMTPPTTTRARRRVVTQHDPATVIHRDAQHLDAYDAYATRFTAAVEAHALTLDGLAVPAADGGTPSLRVPVTVQVETEPDRSWGGVENPIEWAGDPIVWQVWQHAVDTVGLPTLDAPAPEAA